jgi:hypothetical protein
MMMERAGNLFDNHQRLVWRWLPRTVYVFGGRYWEPAGKAMGFLVLIKTWHRDTFYVLPETALQWKQDA